MKKLALLFLLLATAARAQNSAVQQSGPIVPGHLVCFSIGNVIYDCGPGGGALGIGQTSIIGGTNGSILFNNNGTLGNETLGSLLASPGPIGTVAPGAATFTQLTVTNTEVPILVVTGSGVALTATGPQIVVVRQSAPAPMNIILPAAAFYPTCPAIACPSFTIKEGDSGATVTLVTADGRQIDGAASYAWSVPRTSLTVVFDGTMWDII